MRNIEDPSQYLSTIRDFIRWGASQMNQAGVYCGHGMDNTIDEAASLVLHSLHLPPDLHEAYFQAALTMDERRVVLKLLERRVQERKPAAYLMQRTWFMGLSFYVDERVLIPRSPMAELIEGQFTPWLAAPEAVQHILDLGAGCGCLGIACAYTFPQAQVDLVDVSTGALQVAQRNIEEHGLADRVQVIQSHLFNGLAGRRYDFIISNPPYVSHEELQQVPAEYGYEPVQALAAGEKGLDVVTAILHRAMDYLTPDGFLVVEVGNAWYALTEAFPDVPFTWLDFERGGEGVFLLEAKQLQAFQDRF
jgi:ribosomal protein L3 glutamine methyltransferase